MSVIKDVAKKILNSKDDPKPNQNGSKSVWTQGIHFEKIIKQIDYSLYGPGMEDAPPIYVWVNLDKATMDEFNNSQTENRDLAVENVTVLKMLEEAAKAKNKKESDKLSKRLKDLSPATKANNQRVYDWYAKVFSQHEDQANHTTGEELRLWVKGINEQEPAFWEWLKLQTQSLITLHNNQHLKN